MLVQLTSDLLGPLDGLRVLDLACLEGLYGLELAMHGAEVLAIEGREQNAAKVRHAAERLCPARFEVRVEDVRELDPLGTAPSMSSCALAFSITWMAPTRSVSPKPWRHVLAGSRSCAPRSA